ncbi:PREDICTED: F-box protein At1g30790-like [Camelina sativa]|uniref:F-box protein At1g30790-like n=1 Tax=Camelina sativa TaxID=90675 RepID=A0ABM0TES2_CAMSA|nr:PREDICTED: F-box protein At1g30790-like [Camelina sativa]
MEDSQLSRSGSLNDPSSHAGIYITTFPLKLIIEILSRLPAKSLIRFKSVSKLWNSIIRSKDLTDAFLTRSRARPRLLFTFQHLETGQSFIFSAPEHEKEKDKTVVARHEMTITDFGFCTITSSPYYITSSPVNGLVCCTSGSRIAVCNPTTRQWCILPHVKPEGRVMHARLGYDPVGDEYKVLCVMMMCKRGRRDIKQEHLVFTLRSEQQLTWRYIDITGEPYTDVQGGICINGAIYYKVGHTKIARFDIRRERIMFIEVPKDDITSWVSTNHQGKFGGIEYDDNLYEMMRVWIQEKERFVE